jgi:N-methylhydantoinase A
VANACLADLFEGLEARANGGAGDAVREVGLDMRYAGQEHTLTIPVPSRSGAVSMVADEVRELFAADYERTFALTMDEDVEIVSVRATLRTPLPRRSGSQSAAGGDGRPPASVDAYSFTRGEWMPFGVVERSALEHGAVLEGPAIVLEPTATTYVDAEYTARVDGACLFLGRDG